MPGNKPLRERFGDWYRGVPPPAIDPLPPPVPPQESAPSPYHNKTVPERYREWKEQAGDKTFYYGYNAVSVVVCLVLMAVLLITVLFLPPFSLAENPTNNEVPRRYLEQGREETGAINAVAGMILDYRAFDTFGESSVLFIAVCAVLTLLRNEGEQPDAFDTLLHEMEEPHQDIILKKIAMLLVPIILIFGAYVILNGHLGPGGGFSGGAIIGASMILYTSAFGTQRARRFLSYRRCRGVISVSLVFYALAKGYSFFTGANHIPSAIPLGTPGNILSAGLILPLNIAVGLIVACTMYIFYILFSRGEMP